MATRLLNRYSTDKTVIGLLTLNRSSDVIFGERRRLAREAHLVPATARHLAGPSSYPAGGPPWLHRISRIPGRGGTSRRGAARRDDHRRGGARARRGRSGPAAAADRDRTLAAAATARGAERLPGPVPQPEFVTTRGGIVLRGRRRVAVRRHQHLLPAPAVALHDRQRAQRRGRDVAGGGPGLGVRRRLRRQLHGAAAASPTCTTTPRSIRWTTPSTRRASSACGWCSRW